MCSNVRPVPRSKNGQRSDDPSPMGGTIPERRPQPGRGVTMVNIAQVLGCFDFPVLTGALIGSFPHPDGALPKIIYSPAFAFIALATVLGLVDYRRAPLTSQRETS